MIIKNLIGLQFINLLWIVLIVNFGYKYENIGGDFSENDSDNSTPHNNYWNKEKVRIFGFGANGQNNIKIIDNYIVNNKYKVLILDPSAVTYTIPIDRYDKNYNMLLKGNLGSNSYEKITKEINNNKIFWSHNFYVAVAWSFNLLQTLSIVE